MIVDTDKLYWFTSSSGSVEFQLPGQCVIDCYHSGACDRDVYCWVDKLDLEIDPAALISALMEYGAWEDRDLEDHDENVARIVWIAAGDLQETITQGEYND